MCFVCLAVWSDVMLLSCILLNRATRETSSVNMSFTRQAKIYGENSYGECMCVNTLWIKWKTMSETGNLLLLNPPTATSTVRSVGEKLRQRTRSSPPCYLYLSYVYTHMTITYMLIFNYALQVKAYCAIWFRISPPGVSTRVTTREHPVVEGGTVGEKCPVNFT